MSSDDGGGQIWPYSFVMQPVRCAYCRRDDDEVHEARAEWLFGIYYCPEHLRQAEADLRHYFHRRQLVLLPDALAAPEESGVGPLVRWWRDRAGGVPVRRSSGVLETAGWALNWGQVLPQSTPDQLHRNYLFRGERPGGGPTWALPVVHESGGATKGVPLDPLEDPEVRAAVGDAPPEYEGWVRQARAVLDRGFYKNQADATR